MDKAVEKEEDPDGRAHVLDSDKETTASAHMVVRLQGRALLALQEDDGGVDKLVELGDVEPPAVKSKTLVPESSELVRLGDVGVDSSLGGSGGERVALEPRLDRGGRVVDSSVAQSRGTLHPAERVHGTPESVRRSKGVLKAPPRGTNNPDKGPSRVDGEENVVGDHKPEEAGSLADRPWLSTSLAVDIVPGLDDEDIGGGKEEWPFVVERSKEQVLGDGKWSSTED